MPSYIERERVMDALLHEQYGYLCEDAINAIPNADVRTAVQGKWITLYDPDEYARHYWLCCSICGHIAPFGRMSDSELHTNYCPNCGADMKED